MALKRLQADEVYRIGVAHPLAFANWQAPTIAELNANPTNDPHGLIFNLTCALNTEGTQFDLDDPDLDESLTFCQSAGNGDPIADNVSIVYEFERAKDRWTTASSTAAPGFNTANLAQSLLTWRGVEYFAWLSIGKASNAAFAVNDRISLVRVATDWGVDVLGTGENARMSQTFAFRSDVNWRYKILA